MTCAPSNFSPPRCVNIGIDQHQQLLHRDSTGPRGLHQKLGSLVLNHRELFTAFSIATIPARIALGRPDQRWRGLARSGAARDCSAPFVHVAQALQPRVSCRIPDTGHARYRLFGLFSTATHYEIQPPDHPSGTPPLKRHRIPVNCTHSPGPASEMRPTCVPTGAQLGPDSRD